MAREFLRSENGRLEVNLHEDQDRAWGSEKRFVAVLAGKQGGKTCFGPVWLYREIRRCGPGDYLVVTPTYPLLQVKLLPEFRRLFETHHQLGTYKATDKVFEVDRAGEHRLFGSAQDTATRVLFGYADNPESLASSTAKAAWLDEAGQKKFKRESWEEIQARLALHEGRVLFTTTLYNLGWLVQDIWEPWREANGRHQQIDVIRFPSISNPAFPKSEWDRIKGSIPAWKFDLHYRAIPTRPAGLIYDSFGPEDHIVPPFEVPEEWPRYLGLDFGGVNTAALWYARDPESGRYYLYAEYKAGGRTSERHAEAILEGHPMPEMAVGGSRSEGQWRREFRSSGIPVREPKISDVEVGIDRVYGFHARDELQVFETCRGYLEEKRTYSRKLDDAGQPTEKIEDKHNFHFMDAERYILGRLAPSATKAPKQRIVRFSPG